MRKSRYQSLPRIVGSRPGVVALAAALVIVATLALAAPAEAASARVTAEGDCLNMRQSPSLAGAVITCLGDGSIVTTVPGVVAADGLDWQQVRTGDGVGWVAARYLATLADAPAPAPLVAAQPASTAPGAFEEPPPGGLTVGVAGTSSPRAVAAAQTFPVAGVSALDPATQRYLTYIPGAPAIVNTLDDTTLRPDMVVLVRRAGTLFASDTSPIAQPGSTAAATGTARALATPSRDGLTLGAAGTNDVLALIRAQPFAVDVVMALDVSTQRWLTHIPGAPAWVNTLNGVTMRPSSMVFVRRSATAPDPTPVVKPARALSAPITYYYCTQTGAGGSGDGGGFCGFMSNGMRVHAGAASCDRAYRGQRFRIAGDPTGLIYTCMDTGGGVSAEHRDIWFAANDEAYAWWKQVAPTGYATIEVLE